MMYECPVCGYPGLEEPPAHYNICDCCGTEFDNDDRDASHEELRNRWAKAGAPWFGSYYVAPEGWKASAQLSAAGLVVEDPFARLILTLVAAESITDDDRKQVMDAMRRSQSAVRKVRLSSKDGIKDANVLITKMYREQNPDCEGQIARGPSTA